MKKNLFIAPILMLLLLFATSANAFTVATGPTDGYYHNGLFDQFGNALKRVGGKSAPEVTKFDPDNGTDGTLFNIKAVNSGQSDVGFAQLDGALLENMDNVEVLGIIMYEVGNFTYPKSGPVDECDDLRSGKAYSIGMNKLGGTWVTFQAITKTDKKLGRSNVMDYDMAARAINDMTQNQLNSYMFVSVPTSDTVKRMISSQGIKFGDCWDSNYEDMKVNGIQLYTKVKLGKADGYPNSFVTFRVPTVVIANKNFLAKDKKLYNQIFDATAMAFSNIKAEKKFTFYPSN